MLRALLLCALIVHGALGKPLQQQQHGEVAASHIVIVTPQAQVRLDPLPSAYLQHLSPYARYAAPSTHEETIVYVPAGSVGPVVPVPVVAARSSAGATLEGSKQLGNISQIQDITQQIQQSAGQWGPQLSEAATAGAQAITSAGQGFFPALFPPPTGTAAKIEYETPLAAAAPQPLLTTEARHFYAIPSGVVPQVLDFVRGPVFVAPVSGGGVVRARSIKEASDTPPSACSSADMQKLQMEEAAKREQLQQQPLMESLPQPEQLKEAPKQQDLLPEPEAEKKPDYGRLIDMSSAEELKKESDKLDMPAMPAQEMKEQPQALPLSQPEIKLQPEPLLPSEPKLPLESKLQPEAKLLLEEPLQPEPKPQPEPKLQPELKPQPEQLLDESNAASNKLLEPQALPLMAAPAELPAQPLKPEAAAELPIGQLRSSAVVDDVVGGVGVVPGVVGGGVVDVGGVVDGGVKSGVEGVVVKVPEPVV